jgi:hypothetical protein
MREPCADWTMCVRRRSARSGICDDAEAPVSARTSKEWQASSSDDANFVDAASAVHVVTEEYTVLADGRTAGADERTT